MKKVVLFTAMLTGFCAEAVAAPISADWIQTFSAPGPGATPPYAAINRIDVIASDYSLLSSFDATLPAQPAETFEAAALERILSALGPDPDTRGTANLPLHPPNLSDLVRRASEPPAFVLGLIGLSLYGLASWSQKYRIRESKLHRRHKIRVPLREYGLSSGDGFEHRLTARR